MIACDYRLKFFARELIDALGVDVGGVPSQLALEGGPGVDQQAAAGAALELLTNEQERLLEQHRARNAAAVGAAVGGVIAGVNAVSSSSTGTPPDLASIGSLGAAGEAALDFVAGASPHAPGYIHGGPGPPPPLGLPSAPRPQGSAQVSREDALKAAQRLAWTRCIQVAAAAAGRSRPAASGAGGGGHGAT